MKKKKYWFKAKNYGWGWYPVTWQGWAVTLLFVVLITHNAIRIDSSPDSVSDSLINFIPQTFIYVALLLTICYLKGEKPEWRWGGKKIKN